jgi:alkylation response protein AidB-like acyl-CoA dehydrogenase
MLSPEQEEIDRTIRRLVADRSAARRSAEGGPGLDPGLWGKLAELGMIGMALPEHLCGAGLGLAEEATAAEALAYYLAPIPFIPGCLASRILAAGAGATVEALAATLVSGGKVVGACIPAEIEGDETVFVALQADGGGMLTGDIADAFESACLDVLLVHAGGKWWAVDAQGLGVERTEVATFDTTRRLANLTFHNTRGEFVSDASLEKVMAVANTLIAAEAVGAAQAALDLASTYCLQRHQFGQPIGRFGAIKQKMADSLMAVEGGRSAVWGAVRSVRDGVPDLTAARLAKVEATTGVVFVVAEAVQIHGGIGVTWEHDLHLLQRRGKHCQLSLGSPDHHLEVIGDQLMAEPAQRGPRLSAAQHDLGFQPSEEDEAFIRPFRDWLDEHATPEKVNAIKTGGLQARRDWQATLAEAGWVALHWPKAYGGKDASFTQQILYYAEMATRDLPALPGNRGLMLVGPTLARHGTEAQKQLLEPTRRADILWSGGFSEPGAGSDLASLRTRGEVDGDELVINGQKIWTSGAARADWLYTLIRTDPSAPKHDGISVVLIPMKNTPGLDIRPIRRNNGDHEFCEEFFDNVRVPLANVVGPLNEGWRINRTTMVGEHLTNFLGSQTAQANTVRRITRAVQEREAKYGVEHSLRKKLAEAWARTQVVKLHGLRNVARFTGGENPGAEGSIQKLVGQEHEKRLYELLLDVQGVQGLHEGMWTRAYLSTRASTIGGGTSEIHRNKLAERVLGLPRDLWADEEQGAPA